MGLKLHTCGIPGVGGPHPCHKVKNALEEQGIEFELVKNPTFPRGRRTAIIEKTGQNRLPVIEFDDGTLLRSESSEMAGRIRSGRLFEGRDAAPAAQS